jgi:hypothetical protein
MEKISKDIGNFFLYPLGLNLWSLSMIGIDVTAHDIRFVEDNWESPVIFIVLVYNYFSTA